MEINGLKELTEKELFYVHKVFETNICGLIQKLEEIELRLKEADTPGQLKERWASFEDYFKYELNKFSSNVNGAFGMARHNVQVQIMNKNKKIRR